MRDARDIERAMDAYGDIVWRACLAYVTPHDAEDAFQDTFVKYARRDEEFRDEEHKKAWLVRVAVNGCKDRCARVPARMHPSTPSSSGAATGFCAPRPTFPATCARLSMP